MNNYYAKELKKINNDIIYKYDNGKCCLGVSKDSFAGLISKRYLKENVLRFNNNLYEGTIKFSNKFIISKIYLKALDKCFGFKYEVSSKTLYRLLYESNNVKDIPIRHFDSCFDLKPSFYIPSRMLIKTNKKYDEFLGEFSYNNRSLLVCESIDDFIIFNETRFNKKIGYQLSISPQYISLESVGYNHTDKKYGFTIDNVGNIKMYKMIDCKKSSYLVEIKMDSEGKIFYRTFNNSNMETKEFICDNFEFNLIECNNTNSNKINSNDPFEELNNLVGLKNAKLELSETCALAKKKKNNINLHMAFLGNPGTGKSMVAEYVANIYYKMGVLPTNNFIRVSREDIVGEHIGKTEENIKSFVNKAMGGVLFIDEAYSLFESKNSRDFGYKALLCLVDLLEKYKGKFCCIFAGYETDMEELFSSNSGLKSRIPNIIKFDDYTKEELKEITKGFIKKEGYIIDDSLIDEISEIVDGNINNDDFGNARDVRNICERLYRIQAIRTIGDINNLVITKEDLDVYKDRYVEKMNEEIVPFDKELFFNSLDNKELKYNESNLYLKEAVCYIKSLSSNGVLEGSGFIVTPNGFVITCAHCVKNSLKIKIERNISDEFGNMTISSEDAQIVYQDTIKDFAVLKIVSDNKNYPHFSLYNGTNLESLSEIVMFGYPLGKSTFKAMSINKGEISSYQNVNNKRVINLSIQALEGFSGSPVIDVKTCQVIGILKGAIGYQNSKIPLAVDIREVLDLKNEMYEY